MSDEPPKMYRDVEGRDVPCDFTVESEELTPPGWPFSERILRSTNGPLPGSSPPVTEVRQRRLVTPVEANQWRESDLLDNEILIGLHLVRCYGNGPGYPAELSRLIGYYTDDAAQPFLLLAPYQGKLADQLVQSLMLEDEKKFQASLVRAIRLLEIAGVVDGRISPATVRWDSTEEAVLLTDFSEASMAGDPRHGGGEAPWAAAEQQSGAGLADPRDDVWSAAQVIYYVTTRRLPRGPGTPLDPSPRAAALQAVFSRALAPNIAARAHSRELLQKLGGSDPYPLPQAGSNRGLLEGLRKFDERLADKFPQRQPTPAGGTPTVPPPPRSRPNPTLPPRKRGILGWFSVSLVAVTSTAALLTRWWR